MDVSDIADLLPIYYARLFPFYDYYRWLSYGNATSFNRREFSFTLCDEVYVRYLSFRTQKDLEDEIKKLIPYKIDIGAIYNKSPSEQKRDGDFKPAERELVLDIDMTDYDEVRTCCDGASICDKCWKFMVLACKILDATLRFDFGFDHILWVFSGRRGIHCWVCDESARILKTAERAAVAEYMQVITGGDFMRKKVNLLGDKIHHSIRRALDMIEPIFVPMCVEEQNILGTEKEMEKFLRVIQDEEHRQELKSLFSQKDSSLARWNTFLQYVKDKKINGDKKWYQYRHLVEEVMLQYSYPRLDINVTKGMNHLLKSPFCVHPKTGKVCIPFTASSAEKFHPDKVPTIMTLIEEINAFEQKFKEGDEEGLPSTAKKIKDYKKTSINKSLHVFQEFLWGLEASRKGQKIEESDATLEF